MVINDIAKVLYAPHKAFTEIIQNPRYLGPFILLLIFVVAQVGSSYVVASRSYLETTAPQTVPQSQGDVWTENSALWQANEGVTVSNNTVDYINGTYFTTSIEFTASNISNVWMELNNLDGSVNCGGDGFQNVSFRAKLLTPDAKPENVFLYLHSLSDSNFYYDLTSEFSNSVVNVWNNITLTIGVGSEGWASKGADATWENITGFKLDFTWPSSSNVDLLIDGLFFRGDFKDPLEVYGTSYFISSALNALTPFLFQWLLLTGLMYVIIKGLKGSVTWKPLMVAVGFALVTLIIQALILAVTYATLPNLYYPLELIAGIPGEFDVAYQVILDTIATVTMVGSITQVVTYVWIIALGAIITRTITTPVVTAPVGEEPLGAQQFGWLKSILVSAASFLLTLVILGLFLRV